MKMNKINKIAFLLTLGVGMLMFASCSDNDWEGPGPETNPNAPHVYFDGSNPKVGSVAIDAEYLEIAVSRLKTANSLTVPITVTYHADGLSFPENSVTFAAGEETAYFKVKFSADLEYETPYGFGLVIDPAYTDPYSSILPGTSKWDGNLKREEPWVFVGKMDCTFEATSGTTRAKFDPFEQNLYKKEIAGIFKIENWCLNNTGEWYGDFLFTVNEDNIVLPDASVGYHDTSSKRWYFYVPWATDPDNYKEFMINGFLPTSTGRYMTYYYLYTIGSTASGYSMNFDEKAKTARLGGYSRYSSTFSSGTFILNYTW